MKWPFVSRARYERAVAEAAYAAAQLINTSIVNNCLTTDLEHAAHRGALSRKAAARLLAAYREQERRADLLQIRLDDACGLNTAAVSVGRHWQDNRHDKKKGFEL